MKSLSWALILSALIIGGVELAYRSTGGYPSIQPGWTATELAWMVDRPTSTNTIYVVGDSRIGWGFSPEDFDDELKRIDPEHRHWRSVNAGFAASGLTPLVRFVVDRKSEVPGILVVGYSPAAVYHFKTAPESRSAPTRQEFIDEKLGMFVAKYLYTFSWGWRHLCRHFTESAGGPEKQIAKWYNRIEYRGGFTSASLQWTDGRPVNVSLYQLTYYERILDEIIENLPAAESARDRLVEVLKDAQEKGWQVILLRYPVHEKMRAIESRLSKSLTMERIASEVGCSALDYVSTPRIELTSADTSHLSSWSARVVSRQIADDILPYLSPTRD
ncbi:MAG: hypothetical protein KJ626_16125 [Verrucomicrobia bacterium]|nr:hypothetical protein [Verrucomicrobiota bacterium]